MPLCLRHPEASHKDAASSHLVSQAVSISRVARLPRPMISTITPTEQPISSAKAPPPHVRLRPGAQRALPLAVIPRRGPSRALSQEVAPHRPSTRTLRLCSARSLRTLRPHLQHQHRPWDGPLRPLFRVTSSSSSSVVVSCGSVDRRADLSGQQEQSRPLEAGRQWIALHLTGTWVSRAPLPLDLLSRAAASVRRTLSLPLL